MPFVRVPEIERKVRKLNTDCNSGETGRVCLGERNIYRRDCVRLNLIGCLGFNLCVLIG